MALFQSYKQDARFQKVQQQARHSALAESGKRELNKSGRAFNIEVPLELIFKRCQIQGLGKSALYCEVFANQDAKTPLYTTSTSGGAAGSWIEWHDRVWCFRFIDIYIG